MFLCALPVDVTAGVSTYNGEEDVADEEATEDAVGIPGPWWWWLT